MCTRCVRRERQQTQKHLHMNSIRSNSPNRGPTQGKINVAKAIALTTWYLGERMRNKEASSEILFREVKGPVQVVEIGVVIELVRKNVEVSTPTLVLRMLYCSNVLRLVFPHPRLFRPSLIPSTCSTAAMFRNVASSKDTLFLLRRLDSERSGSHVLFLDVSTCVLIWGLDEGTRDQSATGEKRVLIYHSSPNPHAPSSEKHLQSNPHSFPPRRRRR